MKIPGWFLILLSLPLWADEGEDVEFAERQRATLEAFSKKGPVHRFVNTYCAECHGNKKAKGGYNFQRDLRWLAKMPAQKRLDLAVTFTRSGDMPPFEADEHPSEEEIAEFAHWIDQIKYLSPKDPGSFTMRRLTKVEYANTLHALY
ncbi:MAG: c-type cytochrome, partial [Verrucomicrobiales bacterium]